MASVVNGVVMHEPEVCDVMLRFLGPGKCAIDAGANDGYFTGFMSYLVGDEGLVVAFEPDKKLFKALEKNTAELNNVTIRNQALWSMDRPMEFHQAAESGYSAFFKYDDITEDSYMLMARSLDTLLLSPQPSFIKVDCEGADEHVLRGAEQILRRGVECITCEMNFYINFKLGCSEHTLRKYMNWLGYDCFLLEIKQKPLFIRPEDRITVTGSGMSLVNAMFAKRSRVEELWQYDCMENLQFRVIIDPLVNGRHVSVQSEYRVNGLTPSMGD